MKARWKEHFCNLLNKQGSADPQTCNLIEPRAIKYLSVPITELELEKALKTTRCGKASGQDRISAHIWKSGGQNLKRDLPGLYNVCWTNVYVPQDFRDAAIVTIHKKRGLRSECGNHSGISLLSIAGKILAKIILKHIKGISKVMLPESQCGFRAGIQQLTWSSLYISFRKRRSNNSKLYMSSLWISQKPLTPSTERHYGRFWSCMAAHSENYQTLSRRYVGQGLNWQWHQRSI